MSYSQSPPPPPQGYVGSPVPPSSSGKNVGRNALIVGIVAFLLGLVPFLGLALGVFAVALGIMALKRIGEGRGAGRGGAVAAIVLGAIAAITGLIVALGVIVGLSGSDDAASSPAATSAPSEVSPSSAPTVEPEITEAPAPTASTEPAPAPAPPTDPPPAPEPAAAGIGSPVTSGDLGFVVSGVDCSTNTVGSEMFGETAQGKYCIVDLAVTNNGNKANYFTDSQTTLLNAQGQEFSASSASIYLEEGNFLEQINPGNTLAGKVVFDVPADMTPATLDLRDGLFDEGVSVTLG